jgi:predicted PurR-regulated permease PerM
MNSSSKISYYANVSLIFIGLFIFFYFLVLAQGIIVPLIFSIIVATVLSPIVNFFVNLKFNRIVAIFVTLALVISFSIFVIILLYFQIIKFSDSFPLLVNKFDVLLKDIEAWVSTTFNISAFKINGWTNETKAEIINLGRSLLGKTIINIGGMLIVLFLIPVYVFLILLYQSLLVEFIHKLFNANRQSKLNAVLASTKKIIQSYLVGLLLEILIVAILNATSLLIIGIDYAILLGFVGATLNLIPYIGGIIGISLPMLIALATKTPLDAFWVFASYLFIQFIDNNVLVTTIVASKVKINALISIMVVLIGGAMWGVSGMFLSIPLTAIVKLICDNVDGLKPWGFLMGKVVVIKPNKLLLKLNFKTQSTKA